MITEFLSVGTAHTVDEQFAMLGVGLDDCPTGMTAMNSHLDMSETITLAAAPSLASDRRNDSIGICVVGLGPRGLSVLERLCAKASRIAPRCSGRPSRSPWPRW